MPCARACARARAGSRLARLARLALPLAAAVLVGCAGEGGPVRDDATGEVVRAGSWSVFDLRPGDCLKPDPAAEGEIAEIPVVPCSEPHTQEVFASVEHPADAFPGAATLAGYADAGCLEALQTELGKDPGDGWFVSYLLPSFDSWNKEDDRTITCVLVFPTEQAKTGSVVKEALLSAAPSPAPAAAAPAARP